MGVLRCRGSLEEGDEAHRGHAGRPAILKNKVCHLDFPSFSVFPYVGVCRPISSDPAMRTVLSLSPSYS
jgi:hypothetical protein